jgi:glycerophosphoryl diester phosphodiesterase
MRRLIPVLLVALAACKSSGSDPIDPVATAYCEACSEFNNCERLITDTIEVFCTDETRAYYQCVANNDCDTSACVAEWEERSVCTGQAPNDQVRERIADLAPANLGHRGTGVTEPGNPFPENSLSSFVAAIAEGADGVELDVGLTADGQVIVMHDDTLDRTTNCTGCVSAMTLDDIRACRLLDGDGGVTEERPPTLVGVYATVSGNLLVNVELKVYGETCATPETAPNQLVEKVLESVIALNGSTRTLFSSSDESVVEQIKTLQPGFYSALISGEPDEALVERAVELQQDAIHPDVSVTEATVQAALEAGLQVNVWGANTAEEMQAQLDKGATGIITDEPDVLVDLLSTATP